MPECKINPFFRNDIKQFLLARKAQISGNGPNESLRDEIDGIIGGIDNLNVCKLEKGAKGTRTRTGRKPSARNNYIGVCMRKEEKGGMGLDMVTCSGNWRDMSANDRAKYDSVEAPVAKDTAPAVESDGQ